jgi:hypothetical protein
VVWSSGTQSARMAGETGPVRPLTIPVITIVTHTQPKLCKQTSKPWPFKSSVYSIASPSMYMSCIYLLKSVEPGNR